jgi:hypothetical protein
VGERRHPFVVLSLPVEVDERVAPVVAWLNDFPGVRTHYSCQEDDGGKPWVLFVADFAHTLGEIGDHVRTFAEVRVDFGVQGRVRYLLTFPDHATLDNFTRYLREIRKAAA